VPTASSRVFVHSIDEITGYDFRPTFSHDIGHAVTLLISMKQTYTTDDARQLTIGQRKCIFPDEKRLKYYKDDVYSFSQCMRQCRIERSHFFCSCVAPFYHMPPTTSEGIKNYRHCGIEDFSCLLKFHHNITDIRMCKHCELSCLNTVYDIEKFSKVYVADINRNLIFMSLHVYPFFLLYHHHHHPFHIVIL
jgi:acid-sensing ion channel, other